MTRKTAKLVVVVDGVRATTVWMGIGKASDVVGVKKPGGLA